MLLSIQTFHPISAQARPLSSQLSAVFFEAWRIKLHTPVTRARFWRYGKSLFLYLQDGRLYQVDGSKRPDKQSLSPWLLVLDDVALLGFGFDGRSGLLNRAGMLYGWCEGDPPVAVWDTSEVNGEIVRAYGISDSKVLLQVHNQGRWHIEMYDYADGQTCFKQNDTVFGLCTKNHTVTVISRPIDGNITQYDVLSGFINWQVKASSKPITDVIGRVDNTLWLATHGGGLEGYSLASGEQVASLNIESDMAPSGVLDESGIYHHCNGLNYGMVDLRSNEHPQISIKFNLGPDGPTTATGNRILLSNSGLVCFFDDMNKLYVVKPDTPNQPEFLWSAPSQVVHYQTEGCYLLVLCENGCLVALRCSNEKL